MKIALMGAGGKMGCRISAKLKAIPEFELSCIEVSPAGIERLRAAGLELTPRDKAVPPADVVILAIPDVLIGRISREIVPMVKPGCLIVGLDPAAAYAGVMPKRADVSFFVSHPCHPPLFNDETDPKAQTDWFGGLAKQDIVCALYEGSEAHYAVGERLARLMYAPVGRSHRITVEQMAILEPALVESFSTCLVAAMREAMDRTAAMGVPEEAARAFLMGHVRIQFAVLFGYAGFPFSDGARLAMEKAKPNIFKPGYLDQIMNIENIRRSVAEITGALDKT